MRKKDERHSSFAPEMGWLRKLLRVVRLQKLRNGEILNTLNQQETLCKNTATKINLVWSCRNDGEQQDSAQSVTLLHYRQQKMRKAKKNING